MKFGLFYEHQIPRPWNEGDEQKLFQDALDQVELADRLGFDYVWELNTTSLRNIPTPPRPKCFSAHVANEPNRFGSVTASS